MRRRTFLSSSTAAGLSLAARSSAGAQDGAVSLGWLGGAPPALASGVSWGVPWPRGTVRKEQAFALTAADGKPLPLQTWPLAWWPDGSLKWSGFATVAPAGAAGTLRLAPGSTPAGAGPAAVTVKESDAAIDVDTGAVQCRIPCRGAFLIESMTVDGRVVARHGRLIASLADRPELDGDGAVRVESFSSQIRKVTAEQSGPIRAVVRIQGLHKSEKGEREWLPFSVRLYFYAGRAEVRLVHSIVFDGDEQKDFIRGLGLTFEVPMREQVHNRHVRFSGEGSGLWAEPVEPATGWRPLGGRGPNHLFADQIEGKRIPNKEEFDPAGQTLLTDWAVWDSFKLVQATADGFTIHKRTNPESCWLEAGAGRRASGLVFAGDVTGGLGVAVKNFWQSFPSALEVRNSTTEAAELRVWLWSPDAPAMDLRHYDTRAHKLASSYEDVQPGFSTPNGIGRTSELVLYPSAAVPAGEELVQQAQAAGQPPLLVCTPEYLHSVRAFGIWSLPDRSTPLKRSVEDRLDNALAFYQKEVEQRHWYGFWNYGDIMHAYDYERHVWRYDIGGFAWDNTEQASDMWLWYSFLRTGRADLFRMAEAMCRHTSEVDTYHSGRFAPLGSRHNVRHWGCGAKEARISQAYARRFHYYLTTDERTGDVMHEVVDVDYTIMEFDPMRLAEPRTKPIPYPGRIRGGPDWLACVGNWMTEWERTGNAKYRDKILAGMDCISKMPYGFMSGPKNLFGYDPKTGMLYTLADDPFGVYNLQIIMGGAELVFELNDVIDHPGWHKAWLQYCRLTDAPRQVVAADMTSGSEGSDGRYAGEGRAAAYAYMQTRNPAFLGRALGFVHGGGRLPGATSRSVEGPQALNPIDESPDAWTNGAAQTSLTLISVLELCKDRIE